MYGISNIATKASGIILLPIYSSNLSLSEFGALGIIEVTVVILVELIGFGQGQALVMLNNSSDFSERKKETFFTIFSTSLVICSIFVFAGEVSLPGITSFLADAKEYYIYLRLSLYVIALRILNNILLNKFRADERSGYYTLSGILRLLLNLGLITYFVAFNQFKVEGVLYAYIISEGVVLISMLPFLFKYMSLSFDKKIFFASFSFGIPLIFSSLAMMLLNVSDRYIIKYFMTDSDVGLYDLGYRIAGVLNMFIIMPLSLTLMPQAYKMYGKESDKRFYSKILTYITLLLVWGGLFISVFGKEIIKVLAANPNFWPAFSIVPVVTLAYVFFGMRIVASLGMYLTKNTKNVAVTTILTCILNIILNIIFVPLLGIMAAAYSTLVAFVFLYIISWYYSQIHYPINFEHFKILILILLGTSFYFLTLLFDESSIGIKLLIKSLLLIIFPLILYKLNFYEPIEIERIKGFFKKYIFKS